MADIKELLRLLDRLEAPNVWRDAETRRPRGDAPEPPARRRRVGSALVGLSVAAAGLLVVIRAFFGDAEMPRQGSSQAQEYEADAFVLESPPAEPILCFGEVLQTLPPQCGEGDDVAVTNWRWDEVEGEETQGAARWGLYHVVGTFDGQSFTLTTSPGPPKSETNRETEAESSTPCPEPVGGWETPDPQLTSQADLEAASQAAENASDFAGLWVDRSRQSNIVLNVAFTEELEHHESEIRKVWGGPLCVVLQAHSLDELQGVGSEASNWADKELNLRVLHSDIDMINNRVDLQVIFATDHSQDAMDARFGEGIVQVTSVLRPVMSG